MIYLGHGASAGAESMRPHVEGLRRRGIEATAVQLPRSGGAERAMPVFLEQSGSGPEVAVGGHSFGGRVASLLAAEHSFQALVLFSYPLHRPGFPDQLRTELAGKSLAQVAQAHGKTANDVATALKNAAHQRIDQEVTAGRLTADQATQRKQQLDQRIDQEINQVRQQRAPGSAPRGGDQAPPA